MTVSSYTRRRGVQLSEASPPVFCCVPYGATPSGCFAPNSPPPTPSLCFWLRLLAILTASTGFTLSLCVAPPTNLPLSLPWESLVIAIGLNLAVAHLCEYGVLYVNHRHTASSDSLLHNKVVCERALLRLAADRKGAGDGNRATWSPLTASVFTAHLFSIKFSRVQSWILSEQ